MVGGRVADRLARVRNEARGGVLGVGPHEDLRAAPGADRLCTPGGLQGNLFDDRVVVDGQELVGGTARQRGPVADEFVWPAGPDPGAEQS